VVASEKYAVPIPPFCDGPRISYVAMQTRADWCPQDSSIGRLGNSVMRSGFKVRHSTFEAATWNFSNRWPRYDHKLFVAWRGADTEMQVAPRAGVWGCFLQALRQRFSGNNSAGGRDRGAGRRESVPNSKSATESRSGSAERPSAV